MSQLPPLIQSLLKTEAYPEPTASVELGQTHVSYLFFTPDYVYKVKKPVNFGFLDFSTLEKRRHYCQQELVLNRRISPDVYLEVAPVTRANGGFRFGGAGESMEYAVKMRRLPADRMADKLLERNLVTESMVRELAGLIANFHLRAETSPEISVYGSLDGIRTNVEENFQQTEKYIGQSISERKYRRIQKYSIGFLKEKAELIQSQVESGCIKDCHGDLHLAQICFAPEGVRIIDCIEFNERFRYSDVASDIAFLAMDLEYNSRWDLSTALMDEYVSASGDGGVLEVLDFYKSYRAYVRGKVESFRLDDPTLSGAEKRAAISRASRYFDLAYAYASRGSPPDIVITTGLVGAGKSSVARGLASEKGMAVISSDMVRKSLAGVPPTERHYDDYGQGLYSPELSSRTYQEMFRQAAALLAKGQSVVLDATFRKPEDRLEAASLAERLGARFWAVECRCPEEVVKKRLEQREREGVSPSDGRWEIYKREKDSFVPLSEVPPERHIVVDTSRSRPAQTALSVAKMMDSREAKQVKNAR